MISQSLTVFFDLIDDQNIEHNRGLWNHCLCVFEDKQMSKSHETKHPTAKGSLLFPRQSVPTSMDLHSTHLIQHSTKDLFIVYCANNTLSDAAYHIYKHKGAVHALLSRHKKMYKQYNWGLTGQIFSEWSYISTAGHIIIMSPLLLNFVCWWNWKTSASFSNNFCNNLFAIFSLQKLCHSHTIWHYN